MKNISIISTQLPVVSKDCGTKFILEPSAGKKSFFPVKQCTSTRDWPAAQIIVTLCALSVEMLKDKLTLSCSSSRSVIPNGGHLAMFGDVWLSHWGGVAYCCYWHLMGRNQICWYIS